MKRKIFALLLVLAMLLSLAACGKTQQGETPQSSGGSTAAPENVYAAEYKPLNIGKYPAASTVSPACYTEDGFYTVINEKISDEVPEDGAAVTYKGQTGTFEWRLYFVGFDGTVTRLEKYAPLSAMENPEGYADFSSNNYVDSVLLNSDGSLVVLENVYTNYYDGPEGLTWDDDTYWDYLVYSDDYYLRVLDSEGAELSSAKLQLPEDTYVSTYTATPDGQGNILMSSDQKLLAISPEGTVAYEIPLENWVDGFLPLPSGELAVTSYGDNGMVATVLDLEDRRLTDNSYELPRDAWDLIPGSGDYDLYYESGINLFGYKLGAEEPVKLLNLLDCDVDTNSIGRLTVLPDGAVAGVLNTWDSNYENVTTELLTLRQVPSDTLPQKTHLTLAVIGLDYQMQRQIVRFNRNSDTVHIDVRDYSEFDSEENDYTGGQTKLTTEILAGNLPDLLDLRNLPYEQLAAKGLLEDLYPFIDNDPELSREDYFANVLSALEVNGCLYQASPNFYIVTVMGAKSVVGDTPGWNFDQFYAALASMPEGCEPFEYYTTKTDILRNCLSMDMESFVDWTTGQCSFDSPAFVDLLKFADLFLKDFSWEDYEYTEEDDLTLRITQGKQMLVQSSLTDIQSIAYDNAYFGSDGSDSAITYIGYPTNSGVGNALGLPSGFAMSARCADKEAAWQFLRVFLTEDYQESIDWYLPTNRKVFEDKLKEVMTPHYQKDESGEILLDENGEPVRETLTSIGLPDGTVVPIYELSQELGDQVRELAETTTKVYESNEGIFKIVSDEAEAFFQGQKSAEDVAKLIQSKVNIYVNEQR